MTAYLNQTPTHALWLRILCVYVCVCLCVKEREREKEKLWNMCVWVSLIVLMLWVYLHPTKHIEQTLRDTQPVAGKFT